MTVDYDGIALGTVIGTNIQNANKQNQQVFESENLTSFNIVKMDSIRLTSTTIISSRVYTSVFTVYHPVYGIIGSTMSPIGAGSVTASGLMRSIIN